MDYTTAKHLGEKDNDDDYDSQEARIIGANKDMLPKKDRAGQRAQHPKAHATVDATFQVLEIPEADKDLRVGLFARRTIEPLKAVVRFSNSRFYIDNPEKGDAHGMAIKVFGVEGEKFQPDPSGLDTFDFILMNNETFFDGDLAQYANFNDLAGELIDSRRNNGQRLWGAINGIALAVWLNIFDRDMKKAIAETSDQFPDSPVTEKYFSTTPYLLGPNCAVKYIMAPSEDNTKPVGEKSQNFLQHRLREALSNSDQVFTLSVQIKEHGEDSIEDPSIAWKSTRIVPVAKLTIPKIENLDDMAWATLRHGRESLSYNIWNVTQPHRPLGAINRVRKKTYSELHKARTELKPEIYG